jgi:hypothetical protein
MHPWFIDKYLSLPKAFYAVGLIICPLSDHKLRIYWLLIPCELHRVNW